MLYNLKVLKCTKIKDVNKEAETYVETNIDNIVFEDIKDHIGNFTVKQVIFKKGDKDKYKFNNSRIITSIKHVFNERY